MGDLLPQDRTSVLGGAPDDVPIDPKVRVDQDVAEGHDLRPGRLGMPGLQFPETRADASPVTASF